MSLENQVTQFNETYGINVPDKPTFPDGPAMSLCHELILEELMELNEAFDHGNMIEIADALTDIIYVTAQRAITMGLPVDALLREVHRSNMSKLDEQGNPIFRADGKVLKGNNFSEPDIAGILLAKLYPDNTDNTDFQGNTSFQGNIQ